MVQIWVCSDACQNFAPNDADFRTPRKRTSSLLVHWLQWLATPRLLLISQLDWWAHMWHVNVLSLLSFNLYYLWLRPNKHLSMKEGSLFCFVLFCSYEMHWTRMLQILFLVSLESSRRGGVHGLGSMMMLGLAVRKFLNIEWFLRWKFQRNWNKPLVLLERSWWAGFNGNFFGKIWIPNVGDIWFQVISATENSNKI